MRDGFQQKPPKNGGKIRNLKGVWTALKLKVAYFFPNLWYNHFKATNTYVMSMDWFSRSAEKEDTIAHDECVFIASVRTVWCLLHVETMLYWTGTLTAQHVIVCIVCDGVDVWRGLSAPLAFVGGDNGGSVDRQPFVRIHGHAEESRVRLRGTGHDTAELPWYCTSPHSPTW